MEPGFPFEKMLAVTNRSLCSIPFPEQLRRLARLHPGGILLREKDLSEEEYEELAEQALSICKEEGTVCILHSHPEAARRLGCGLIHLPLERLRELSGTLGDFRAVGASVHSPAEAREAETLGASYVTAGHVFETDCKRGVPARGLGFLREVCGAVQIPVCGIGGITEDNYKKVLEQGAAGYCLMSGAMRL